MLEDRSLGASMPCGHLCGVSSDSHQGAVLPPGDAQQCLETFLFVITWDEGPGCHRHLVVRDRMLLNALQCTGQAVSKCQ